MSCGWDLAKRPPKGGQQSWLGGNSKGRCLHWSAPYFPKLQTTLFFQETQYQSTKFPPNRYLSLRALADWVVPESLVFGMILRLREFVVRPLCTRPAQGRQC